MPSTYINRVKVPFIFRMKTSWYRTLADVESRQRFYWFLSCNQLRCTLDCGTMAWVSFTCKLQAWSLSVLLEWQRPFTKHVCGKVDGRWPIDCWQTSWQLWMQLRFARPHDKRPRGWRPPVRFSLVSCSSFRNDSQSPISFSACLALDPCPFEWGGGVLCRFPPPHQTSRYRRLQFNLDGKAVSRVGLRSLLGTGGSSSLLHAEATFWWPSVPHCPVVRKRWQVPLPFRRVWTFDVSVVRESSGFGGCRSFL